MAKVLNVNTYYIGCEKIYSELCDGMIVSIFCNDRKIGAITNIKKPNSSFEKSLNEFLKIYSNTINKRKTSQLVFKIIPSDLNNIELSKNYQIALKLISKYTSNINKIDDPSILVKKVHFDGLTGRMNWSSASKKKLDENKIKNVMIIEDSKVIQNILKKIIDSDPGLTVSSIADNPLIALKLINRKKPDAITLDIHMPEMDGIVFLEKYYKKYQIPTILITSVSKDESELVLKGLKLGATDYIEKPNSKNVKNLSNTIIEKIKVAIEKPMNMNSKEHYPNMVELSGKINSNKVVLIGASTGGTVALAELLEALPNNIPPILIVQHIPEYFSAALAKNLNSSCTFTVKEAENGETISQNTVYIAPGGKQMTIRKVGHNTKIEIKSEDISERFNPSANVLFNSAVSPIGKNAICILLTGMGDDGAVGMNNLHDQGAFTIAQDKSTCVVFGMPKEAIRLGCVDIVSPLSKIAFYLMKKCTIQTSKNILK